MVELKGARVLVLGGSRFMGPPTIRHLLAAGAEVTMMNRGVSDDGSMFGGAVTHVKCDRQTPAFAEFLRGSGAWDVIVDYIAYTVEEVEPLLAELGPARMGACSASCAPATVGAAALQTPE
jgi:nucleoside-diphosphate-sugar epimerase